MRLSASAELNIGGKSVLEVSTSRVASDVTLVFFSLRMCEVN